MSPEQIAELYIQAAEVDRRLPQTAKPARLKAMTLPFIHDQKDMNGWGAERYQEERSDFFDAKSTRITRNEIGIWEVSMELIKLVRKPECRRALWAWASAKAGGMSVAKWSRTVENVHPETASRRAKSAISEIHRKLSSKAEMHSETAMEQVLPDGPEIGDKSTTLRVWRPDESKPVACGFDAELSDFSWADLQNAKRRERDARRRKAA